MIEWQLIKDAPLDGSPVDLWANGKRWTDCRWGEGVTGHKNKGNQVWVRPDHTLIYPSFILPSEATHFMYPPEPPEEPGQ